MTDIAIRTSHLGKRYELAQRQPYKALRDVISDAVAAPLRRRFHGDRALALQRSTLWALKDVSLDIKTGEVLGIVGRNGAGKTTLLRLLSRITEPTEGEAQLNGRVGTLLEVGTGFHPELTGRENVFLNGAILGMKKAEVRQRFDEIVAFAEVERFLDTPVKHYSSGMRVRLAFAVAAHLNPEILLVDEVLAVGDAAFQKKCFGKVSEVARSGRTVLLVSHNMPSIMAFCTRAVMLEEGRVATAGSPREVIERYLATVRTAGGERTWDDPRTAPGNDVVRLVSVRILQGDQSLPTADVDIAKETTVELTFRNLQGGVSLYSAVWLRDELGTAVLSSGNHRSVSLTPDPWSGRGYPTGLFRSTCRIPANFLNEGVYSITPIVGKNVSETQAIHEDAVSFRVHDTGDMRKEYFGGWMGVVRPRLAWATEQVFEVAELV